MCRNFLIIFIGFFINILAVDAQDMISHDSEESQSEILVTAARDNFVWDYQRLQGIDKAFKKYHHHAPTAPLKFRYIDTSGAQTPLAIWIKAKTQDIAVPVQADGSFIIPEQAYLLKGALHINRPAKALRVYADILSPGASPADQPLGDFRLRCRVMWAVTSREVSLFVKSFWALDGGACVSSKIAIRMQAQIAFTSATVMTKDGPRKIRVYKDNYLRPPVYDKKIPDTAIVSLR